MIYTAISRRIICFDNSSPSLIDFGAALERAVTAVTSHR
jgi:hypothetical protein